MSSAARTILDRAYLSRQTFGDRDLERELLRLFDGQCRRLLPTLIDREGPAETRLEAAHALKSAARAVGANAVAELSHALEEALDAKPSNDVVEGLAARLRDAIDDVLQALARGRSAVA